MVLKQYQEEQEHLMPFDAHGMKSAPPRDIKDMIKDMKEAKSQKSNIFDSESNTSDIKNNIQETQKFLVQQ